MIGNAAVGSHGDQDPRGPEEFLTLQTDEESEAREVMNGPDRLGLAGGRVTLVGVGDSPSSNSEQLSRVVSLGPNPTVTPSIILLTLLCLKRCFVPLLVRHSRCKQLATPTELSRRMQLSACSSQPPFPPVRTSSERNTLVYTHVWRRWLIAGGGPADRRHSTGSLLHGSKKGGKFQTSEWRQISADLKTTPTSTATNDECSIRADTPW
ncbi:hypothetical protein C8Q74DRAFT_746986 [Fomes fomentarius]|nr:hypothetical protein C8Q74DRAFT_746986 [Fomes fomentarius]